MKHPARIDTTRPCSSRPGRLATAWLVALLIAGCGGGGSDSGSSSGDSSGGIVPVVAPAAVTDVVATASDDTVVLTFTVPEPQNVTGFKATCVGTDQAVTATASANGTASGEVRIIGLTHAQDQHYSCTVTAFNGGSVSSAATAPVAATNSGSSNTPDQPRDTTVTAGPTSAVIDFSGATVNGGTAVSSYVGVCTGADLTAYSYAVASPLVVEGLTPGVDYTCSVSGINADGQGTASASFTVRPLADAPADAAAPTAPSNVAATPGAGSASIAFVSALTGGSNTAVVYRATCSTAGSAVSAESPASPITVPRLTNGRTYSCVVTATMGAVTSSKSSPASVVPFTVPDAPTLTDIASGDRIATLSFLAPASDGGSAVQGYHATCLAEGQANGTGVVNTAGADTTSAGTVTVAGLTNGSTYLCSIVARNASDRSSDASESRRASPSRPDDAPAPDASQLPAAPTSLQLQTTAGNGSATFSFTPVTGGTVAVLDYTVTCSAGNETVPGTGLTSPIVVSPLRSDVEYTCSVAARANAGSGEASTAVKVTLAAAVPKAPDLDDPIPGNQTIKLSFRAASDDVSSIAGFTATCGTGTTPVSAGSSPITVSGLVNGQTYSCSVYATNQAGVNGKSSNSKPAKPRTVPGQPLSVQAVGGNLSITVSYATPQDDGGAEVLGYVATCDRVGDSHVSPMSKASDRLIVVTGLENDKAYDCRAQAVNSAGTGPASAVAGATPVAGSSNPTPPEAPSKPGIDAGDQQLTIHFSRPVANDSTVTYELVCSPGAINLPALDANEWTVTNLINDTEYACQVSATNPATATSSNSPIAKGTPAAKSTTVKPVAPGLGTVLAGDRMLTIPYTRPAGNAADVVYSASCGAGSAMDTGSTFVISSLDSGTSYTCTVSATNPGGTASTTVTATTLANATPPTPSKPVISLAVPGETQIVLSFSPNAESNVAYTGRCNGGTSFNKGSDGKVTVTGLMSGTTYACTVTATNSSNVSVTSAASTSATTLAPATLGGPVTGDGQVSLSFTEPGTNPGGTLYTASCATIDTGTTVGTGSSGLSPLTVTGLANGSVYMCGITASKGAGVAKASIPVALSPTPSKPSISLAAAGDQQIVLGFTPNAESNVGYTGRCNGGTSFNKGSDGNVTVTGLTNGTPYTCTVTATNPSNVSVTSAASTSATPLAPATLLGSITGDGLVSLSFKEPETNPSGTLYTASCATIDTGTTVGTGSSGHNPLKITGLANGSTYMCGITASKGAGVAKASMPVVLPATVPGQPTNVSLTTSCSGSQGEVANATVSWGLPSPNGSAAVDYFTIVLVLEQNGRTTTKTPQNTTGAAAGSMQWTNVGSGTFTAKISAHNAFGNGSAATTVPVAASCWGKSVTE
ncbi:MULTISPECIES: fibronectin type III domain-containing protein [unclassified Rhizobacter]|uniref:fibronectin type III domain-containing protein n=1 Tax=unclassified Rhizobacter TaxID=2640088 RepID=UPI0006F4F493|nr:MULTISPECIES: fibronectin type III domain-containing protein [unclassified Rhizobacter]KQV98671.1 hypothetical protein ASC98_08360 [Rhizobacter sp. Root1238]KRB04924.1 hypothetical protein ASE08_13515 [Rhizobacter sp. Root16D2]